MTEVPLPSVKTLAIRLPDELHAQLVLVASLDGVSLAEAVRQAVEASITRRRDSGELAVQAQAALDDIDRETTARRAALQGLLGPTEAAAPAEPLDPPVAATAPTTNRRGRDTRA